MPCTKSRDEPPEAFLILVWTGISSSGWALWGYCFGFWGRNRFTYSHHSSCTVFLETLPVLWISHSRLSPACPLGSFIINLNIYKSLSEAPASQHFVFISALQPLLLKTATAALMDLPGTWWEAAVRDVKWANSVFTCCLARLSEPCRALWQQRGRVREVRVWMEVETPGFYSSHILHILTKESYWQVQELPDAGNDCPSCTSFIHSCFSSLFSLPDSLITVWWTLFATGLCNSWATFILGNWEILIEEEIRNANSHCFAGDCSVKARKWTRRMKMERAGEWVQKIGHVLKKKKWKRASLTSRLYLHYL